MKLTTRTMIQDNGSVECYVLDKRTDEYNRILTWYPWCRRLHLNCADYITRTTAKYLNLFCSDLGIPVRTKLEKGEFHSTEYNPPMPITGGRALSPPQADPYDSLTINGGELIHQFWSSWIAWDLRPLPQYGIGEDD